MSQAANTISTVIPTLRYADARAAIDWLCRAFGFEEHMVVEEEGVISHAQLKFGNGMVMVGDVRPDTYGALLKQPADIGGAETQSPYVIVKDAAAHYARAKESGAEIVTDLEDQPHGGGYYACRDLEGHLWNFGSYDPWKDQAG